MKKLLANLIFISLILAIIPNIAIAQGLNEIDTSAFAQIDFEKTDFNFGDLNQGEKAEHIFEFKNVGQLPLILDNVLTTCGCTVPEWPKHPILPDSIGVIKVVFDSTSKIGRQNKVITIRSNSKKGDFRLRISAMVLPQEKTKNK